MKRLKHAFYFFIVLGVIYTTNRIDEQHFKTAQHSLNSIYNDRVIAQHIIHQISSLVHQKEIASLSDGIKNENQFDNQGKVILQLLEQYNTTILIKKERRELVFLEKNIDELFNTLAAFNPKNMEDVTFTNNKFEKIKANLHQLSEIQLLESKNIQALGQKSLNSNNLLSMAEITVIIFAVIALIVLNFFK